MVKGYIVAEATFRGFKNFLCVQTSKLLSEYLFTLAVKYISASEVILLEVDPPTSHVSDFFLLHFRKSVKIIVILM